VAGQTSVVVISSISAGIASIKTTTAGVINATTGAVTTQPVITVKEGFLNAWGAVADQTNVGIKITLSAAPPAGVSIQFPLTAGTDSTGVFQTMNSSGVIQAAAPSAITSSSSSLVVYYKAATSTDPTKVETLTIPVTLSSPGSATLPLPVTTLTYVVSLAPIGTAFDADGNVDATQPIPRFVQSDVGPANLFSIIGNTTSILIPFAQTVTNAGYDTGFAVANTTEDPGKTITSYDPPVAQAGAITFYFFPQVPSGGGTNPANFSYTTGASSPGTGLDSTGKLPAGSTYTVLLSQLLAAGGFPADFAGYVVAVANFTNAHCLYVVSNFTTFSQGSLGLIITGARTNVPEALNN
jgi:hypothetical protein